MILSHSERQRLEGIRARSPQWQESGMPLVSLEQLQHDIYFMLLILDKEVNKEGDRLWTQGPYPLIEMFLDGDQWCALLGENLQEGDAGFGDTRGDALRRLADRLDKKESDRNVCT